VATNVNKSNEPTYKIGFHLLIHNIYYIFFTQVSLKNQEYYFKLIIAVEHFVNHHIL